MNLSPTAQATLLLTTYFSNTSSESVRPLSNGEWGRFALWLKERSITPADLLVLEAKSLLEGWHDSRVSTDRILHLLNRGHALALAVEKWQRAGLWVVTRSDPEYPRRLKQRLKTDAPPVLFGCGNKALLNSGGLAVIGSRSANDTDLSFANQVGAKAATSGIAIVSGGARGVDETAMLGALQQGGVVIGIMADSLLKSATSAKWRKGLMEGYVVLISPFYPEAGFNAGNAMARNKYIYCLADSSLVIHSGKKGGTISGAQENLDKKWIPLWVKPTDDKDAANADLVAQGGYWCASEINNIEIGDLFQIKFAGAIKEEQTDLFSTPKKPELFLTDDSAPIIGIPEKKVEASCINEKTEVASPLEQDTKVEEIFSDPVNFYLLFISELQRLALKPITAETLIGSTGLHKSQLNEWLARAIDEGVVEKLGRPTRYQVIRKLVKE